MNRRASSYGYDELLACARGELFGPGNAKLPLPPMLMFDRITEITDDGGLDGKGYVRGELSITPDLWFFKCHFHEDPVMPGCLMLDALWQLLGFFLCWFPSQGVGRALSVGKVVFSEQVLPSAKCLVYTVNLKRVVRSRMILGVADGNLTVDGKEACSAKDLKVCLMQK